MSSPPPTHDPNPPTWLTEQERLRTQTVGELQRQLIEAQNRIKLLDRELRKERAKLAETSEAYNKTVSNMVEIARENAMLSNELERIKRYGPSIGSALLVGLALSPSEARAVRKAMARLHHPDVGGDEQRMKLWNAALDPFIGPE